MLWRKENDYGRNIEHSASVDVPLGRVIGVFRKTYSLSVSLARSVSSTRLPNIL